MFLVYFLSNKIPTFYMHGCSGAFSSLLNVLYENKQQIVKLVLVISTVKAFQHSFDRLDDPVLVLTNLNCKVPTFFAKNMQFWTLNDDEMLGVMVEFSG